jgi:CheY-like chemotaxis protein
LSKETNHLNDLDLSFKVFYELMANRVGEILLVSSPYDAFIMEEDGRLAERIIHEYRGLNLTRPPRLTWKSSAREALNELSEKKFDLMLTMPRIDDMETVAFCREVKTKHNDLPIFLLTHDTNNIYTSRYGRDRSAIDREFVWLGNTDLLLALIKSVEDRMNVAFDTERARVRVIILVEDSPLYRSSILPLLYKEIVMQTQAVMEESLNEEHRYLRMRARPKILIAETFEEALDLYEQFEPYMLCVLSDVRFMRYGATDNEAGFSLLKLIKQKTPHLPLLMCSSEETNRQKAATIPAVFLNKNSPSLHTDIRSFFVQNLGFGEFIFQLPDGREVGRAVNLRTMEKVLPSIPNDSILYHAKRNDFSTWLIARSEIQAASKLRPVKTSDFTSIQAAKEYLVDYIQKRRKERQRGVVVDFVPGEFDPDTDIVKIGKGSLGGKARGLAFMWDLLKQHPELQEKYPEITIHVPKMLVISTDGFDAFVKGNALKRYATADSSDRQIVEDFLNAHFPDRLARSLETFLEEVTDPLAVRSSSLFEDAQYYPCAGIYNTYMLPNNDPSPVFRLKQLIQAVKLVYASTYLEIPRSFAKRTGLRTEEEKMAVIVQQLTGKQYGGYFYPAISGIAQSYNYYPISYMEPKEGIAHIALGLGKIVVEDGTALRFSPKYPRFLPQFSNVKDILENSQRMFYALKLRDVPENLDPAGAATLKKLDIDDAKDHPPIQRLSSTYLPEDQRIRDTFLYPGHHVLTFAGILKYQSLPVPEILLELLDMGRKGMGCPVEMEFSLNLSNNNNDPKTDFSILQIRPMAACHQESGIEATNDIYEVEIDQAVCFSSNALGNGIVSDITDIVYVDPDIFNPAHTVELANEISKINGRLIKQQHRYLLIGPGRWGSADRWLGIPVNWRDISGVGIIIETTAKNFRVDPSQGTHFFHNIISMGISYLTISEHGEDFIDFNWLKSLPAETVSNSIRHVRLNGPLTIKIDGRTSRAVIFK